MTACVSSVRSRQPAQRAAGAGRVLRGRPASARSIVASRCGRSSLRWRAVRRTLASSCCVSALLRVRLPPQTLRVTTAGRMAGSAREFGASIDGSYRNKEQGCELVGQLLGEALGVGLWRRGVDQPAELGDEATAGRRQTVLADAARLAD